MSSWNEPERARTVAVANAQELTLPDFHDWTYFAETIDGYDNAKELAINVWPWWSEQSAVFDQTGRWDQLDVLGLRLMLFLTDRSLRSFSDFDSRPYQLALSLLQALGESIGQPYPPLETT